MTDLNEAAARLASGETYAGDVEDCIRVAQAYLARLAADERDRIEREKPIDHEWFRRNGDDTSSIRIYVGGCEYEIEKDSGDGINLTVYLGGAMEFCAIPAISTVGQLLDLLRALGVEAKGTTNG